MTRSRPTTPAKFDRRSATVSGCSTTAVVCAMTPGISTLPSGTGTSRYTPLVRVAWLGRFDGIRPGPDSQHEVDDVAQAEVVEMRSLPAPPAEVIAHAVLGNAGQGVVQGVDIPG